MDELIYTDVEFVSTETNDSTIETSLDSAHTIEETESEKLIKAKMLIDYDTLIQLTKQDWIDFEKLLNENSFWTKQSFKTGQKLDGSDWIIEAHKKNKYWFVIKSSPRDNFKDIGEFLIGKSGLDTEVY